MKILTKTYLTLKRIIKRLLGPLELFLFLRLTLIFLGANPMTPIVKLIYKYSDILISPFRLIFSSIYWRGNIIEVVTVSAMIGYAVLVFIFFYFLDLLFRY